MQLLGRISQHFSWHEVLFSQTASSKGIKNIPTPLAAANLKAVALLCLEPTRTHFGKPARVTSGYRSPALNKAIGGSMTSNHSIGCASDFEIPGIDNHKVAEWMVKNLPDWDEIILEDYTPGDPNSGWIHVAIRPDENRRKILTWNRRDGYKKGLVK